MFGSVPLRTYLPDGDIDISVFKGDSSSGGGASPFDLRDTWATQLLKALEAEQQRPDVPFKIRDLHIIQAEASAAKMRRSMVCCTWCKASFLSLQVKLVKCVVADLVVDVSFESIGGLCTVAFLESIDRKIGRAHLFKRSIVLVSCWTSWVFSWQRKHTVLLPLELLSSFVALINIFMCRLKHGAIMRVAYWEHIMG